MVEAMMNDTVEVGMVDTAEAEVIMDNTRIEGAPPLRRNNGNQLDRNRWIGIYKVFVYSTIFLLF